MKLHIILILLTGLFLISSPDTRAQNGTRAAQTAENLRAQLSEVRDKEEKLESRARQLDEDLKPENIERSLAGVGSTRPEELRELRRRQFSIEKASLQTQLEQLKTSRTRLESAILTADSEAYQQSAQGTGTSLNAFALTQYFTSSRWLVGVIVGFVAVAAIAGWLVGFRRNN